ncbi:MAG: TIGR02452 family protein [Planctomycetota bacterium]
MACSRCRRTLTHSEWFLRDQPGATDELAATFLRRWRSVRRSARHQGTQSLVRGAWGCGAFGGDPRMASATAQQALAADGGGIARVVFAIPRGTRQTNANLAAFEATFGAG